MANPSLSESIQSALQAHGAETTETTETTKTTETSQQTTATGETETETVEVDASPEEINSALEMYRTLSNPATAKEFISNIAKEAGFVVKATGASTETVTESVLDILKTALGEENSDLADKLAPALEKLIAKEVKAPIANLSVEQQIKDAKLEIDNVFARLNTSLPDFSKLQNEMGEVMKSITPAKGVSMEAYMTQVYKLAGGKMPTTTTSTTSQTSSTKKTPVKTLVQKMVQNAKETKTNVSSNVEESGTQATQQKLSPRESVMKAMKELQSKTS